MSTRIDRRFAALMASGEKGFVAFITAGDPGLTETEDMVLRLGEVGVDIIELGIPFSDPLADGRVNQESAARALATVLAHPAKPAGLRLRDCQTGPCHQKPQSVPWPTPAAL